MNLQPENINPLKYRNQINSLYWKLKHMLVKEMELDKVVEIYRDPPVVGKIILLKVQAKANVDERLTWINNKESKVVGTLSCEETIEINDNGDYVRTFFSFHFEAEPSSDLTTFRVDYAPDQKTPLHAHDYITGGGREREHLEYPKDVTLNLSCIDFCTIMVVISFYIKHKDKYPLFAGRDYNPLIIKKRRRYDEYREHSLF